MVIRNKAKKIAICHYRVGGTDGVSLEIAKRKEILEKFGCEVHLIAGPRSTGTDHIIKELEWDEGDIPIIKENGFIYFRRKDLTILELKKRINIISDKIENRLNFIQCREKFDQVLVHNIFSFGGHLAAAKAFAKWIKKFKIPCLATHHDFSWEFEAYSKTRNQYLKNFMEKYMPPKSMYISHVVINSLSQKKLKRRYDINASVIPDVFDFRKPPNRLTAFNHGLLKDIGVNKSDLIILQATRIKPRKAIEIAIEYAEGMQAAMPRLRGKTIYNGKKLSHRANVILLLAGYAENEDRRYLEKIQTRAQNSSVEIKFIADMINGNGPIKNSKKHFDLWDVYACADLVTFPSVWEGWGNQFIEAVFAKRPVAVYEYPVFRSDIRPEGYLVISLGGRDADILTDHGGLLTLPVKNFKRAIHESLRWLIDENTSVKLEKNFQIGRKYHDYRVLEDFLIKQLSL